MSDWHLSSGPRWQAHHSPRSRHPDIGEQTASHPIRAAVDHLYIGLQHDLQSAPFSGSIDELALHGTGLLPRDLAVSLTRRRRDSGEISSSVIKRPAAGWGRFVADAPSPAGTGITFSVTTSDGTPLRADLSSGDALADLDAPEMRLAAQLTSTDPGQTPVLRSWRIERG